MPIYEFDCQSCGKPFEELVFSSASLDKVECPACHSREIVKKVSLIGGSTKGATTSSISTSACTTST